MSSEVDKKILEELRNLPDLKLDFARKREMLTNMMETQDNWQTRNRNVYRLMIATKGVVAASLLVGGFWLGSQFFGKPSDIGAVPGYTGAGYTGADQTVQQPAPTSPVEKDDQSKIVKQIIESSRQGKVPNVEYAAAQTTFDQIEKAWGKPDKQEFINGLAYATYETRGIVYAYNKGAQIADIRSYAPELRKISRAKVMDIAGKPEEVRNLTGQIIDVYKVSNQFELKFIFAAPTESNPDPLVDHISVFYPRGAENLMTEEPGSEEQQTALLQSMRDLAGQGKVPNVPYAVESTVIDDIEKEWGKPDKREYINGLSYSTYTKKGIVFAFNKGQQIVDIRSSEPQLRQIPLSAVKQVLGNPTEVRNAYGQAIYVYNVSDKYQLKVIFPAPSKKIADPTIDHISVYYPRGTLNFMAN